MLHQLNVCQHLKAVHLNHWFHQLSEPVEDCDGAKKSDRIGGFGVNDAGFEASQKESSQTSSSCLTDATK